MTVRAIRRLVAVLVLAVCASPLVAAAPATKPAIYDESADAKQQLAAAEQLAARDHQRVLMVVGGNWCGWCVKLDKLFHNDKEIAALLRAEYQVVHVDINDSSKAVLSQYGIAVHGVPCLAVFDPDDKLVTQHDTGSLEDGPNHDPA